MHLKFNKPFQFEIKYASHFYSLRAYKVEFLSTEQQQKKIQKKCFQKINHKSFAPLLGDTQHLPGSLKNTRWNQGQAKR